MSYNFYNITGTNHNGYGILGKGMIDMPEEVGLRERKKLKIHRTIVEKAWEPFTEKGFDNVKVTDIADQSDISVKTLFTYFNSKEDIIFSGEDELLEEIIATVHLRNKESGILDSVLRLIQKMLNSSTETSTSLNSNELIKLIASNPAIQKRLLVMWQKYENKLAEALPAELNMEPGDPRVQVIACNLILPFRMLFEIKIKGKGSFLADDLWLKQTFEVIKAGLVGF